MRSILIIFLFIIVILVGSAGKKHVSYYTFDQFVDLIGLKKGDPHLKSVVKNKNYKFKYNKNFKFWQSKTKGVRITMNSYDNVSKVEFSVRSFGEKYRGDLPNSCTFDNILDSFDWYRSSKVKWYTGYKKNYLITVHVTEGYNGNFISHLEVKRTNLKWVERPPMQDCLCDDTPPEELTGEFEGDKILDYVGRFKTDPRLVSLIENSPLAFAEKENGNYYSKDKNVIIKFSEDMFVNGILILKGFKRTVPGNITLENVLSCKNWKYSKGYNHSEVEYKGYFLSIYISDNNEIRKLVITPNADNAEKNKILFAKQKFKSTRLEGDKLLTIIGKSLSDDYVNYIIDEYEFVKGTAHGFEQVNDQYDSKSLGLSLLTNKKTNLIERILISNTAESKFTGKLPYDIKMDSFLSNTNVKFKKISDIYGAKRNGYLFIASTSNGVKADNLMFQKIEETKKSNNVASSSNSSRYEKPDYSISKIISVTSDKLKAKGWNYVKQKVSYTPVKGYDQYSLDLEFNTFPNNLYVVTVVYTDNIVEYCNTFINGQHIKAESNDHAEGYRLLTHPFRSGQGGHIKTSATIHFPFIDKNKYETDFAIVVYRKPI